MLYLYYGSKDELFSACILRESARFLEALVPAGNPSLSPREQVRAGLLGFLGIVDQHRDSWLVLYRQALGQQPFADGLVVREEPYSIEQWRDDAASGRLVESFACGTAAVVTPIGRVAGPGYEFTIGSGSTGQTTQRILDTLNAIQRGRAPDPHGWREPVLV